MKLTRRQINLIKLIQENSQLSLKELEEITGVSLQTIKTDLENLRGVMSDYKVAVEIVSGNKLQVWGAENFPFMIKAFQTMQEFSLEKQMLLLLVLREDFVVLQDIADELFVSKSLAEKVMSVLLKKYPDELYSMRRHGIRNISSQMERRSRFSEILRPYVAGVDFKKELEDFNTNHFPLLDYLEETEIERVAEAIDYIRGIKFFTFTDEAISQLYLQLVFAKSCYRRWSKVDVGTLAEDMLEGMSEQQDYRSPVKHLCKIAGIDNPKEQAYFRYLFLILRKQRVEDSSQFVEVMREVILELFDRIYQRLAVDFRSDSDLFKGLALHIYSTVIRRDKLGTSLEETGMANIKTQYPLGFEMAAISAEVIQEKFTYKVSEREMIYLTLHFQAGIERMKSVGKKVRVLVVCHYGLAAASLISVRIEQMFPAIQIVDSVSMQHFLRMSNIQADLVLSTENIKVPGDLPIIYVTPMLAESELKQIRRFVETNCINNLLMIFLQNALILNSSAQTKSAVLRESAEILEKNNFVSDGFLKSIVSREEISTTDVEYIAIPHGNPDFVKETQLLVVRLANGVAWGKSKVRLIFIFAISRDQFEKNFALFSSFYKRLARVEIRAALRRIQGQNDSEFKKNLVHLLSQ